MPHIAGLRGVVPEASKAAELANAPLDVAKGLAAGTLARDVTRCVYRYHVAFAGPGRQLVRKSIVAAVRLSPWAEGMIRRHEEVTDAARAAALARIKANGGAHTQAVMAGVRDTAAEVDRFFRRAESGPPTLKVTTKDGVHHTMWRVSDAEVIGKLRNYFTPKKLHVLDGHDTYEGMLAYQAELAAKAEPSMYSSANYGLFNIVTMEDQGLVSAALHKVVKGAGKRDELLEKTRKHFIVEKLAGVANQTDKLLAALGDSVAHQAVFVAVFAGDADAYKLTLSPDVSPVHEGVAVDRALAKLDPNVVEHMFVRRHLASATITSEPDAKQALAALGSGAELVLLVRPTSIEQRVHVDELNQTLPPSSTTLYPAPAQLVAMIIDPDEEMV
ncbi:MAG: DUF1015 family protein [Myxococcales bacterium]|nr:DUF1015 family protein [Myxococcales bacterium]